MGTNSFYIYIYISHNQLKYFLNELIVNEQEAKRYQSLLVQNQRRQQAMQLQQQQLQRQRMQVAGGQISSAAMSQRLKEGTGSSGLRISSVSTLQNNSYFF